MNKMMRIRKLLCVVLVFVVCTAAGIVAHAEVNEYKVEHKITIDLGGGSASSIYYQSTIDRGERAGVLYDDLRVGDYLEDRLGKYHTITGYDAAVPVANGTITAYYDCVGLTPYVTIDSVSRSGYTFTGWTVTGSSGETVGTTGVRVQIGAYKDKDIEIKANWKRDSYTLSVDMYYLDSSGNWVHESSGFSKAKVSVNINGSRQASMVKQFGKSVVGDSTYSIYAYPSDGWEINRSKSSSLTGTVTGNKCVSIYVQPKTITASYQAGVAQDKGIDTYGIPANEYFLYGCSYTYSGTATVPSAGNGLTFKGWARGDKYEQTALYSGKISLTAYSQVTFYAVWNYTVRFDPNATEGVSGSMPNATYQLGCDACIPTCGYTRKGYTFAGWNTKSDGTGQNISDVSSINMTPDGSGAAVLYAMWKPITYTVRLYGGKPSKASSSITNVGNTSWKWSDDGYYYEECRYDGELYIPNVRDAYSIVGWSGAGWSTADGVSVSQGSSAIYNFADTDGSVVSLTATWKVNRYNIVVDSNGGYDTEYSVITGYEDENTLPDAPVRPGYTFDSWNTDVDGEGTRYEDGDDVSRLVTDDGGIVTIYAQWKQKNPICLKVTSSGYGNALVNSNAAAIDGSWLSYTGVKSASEVQEITDEQCVQVWEIGTDSGVQRTR